MTSCCIHHLTTESSGLDQDDELREQLNNIRARNQRMKEYIGRTEFIANELKDLKQQNQLKVGTGSGNKKLSGQEVNYEE